MTTISKYQFALVALAAALMSPYAIVAINTFDRTQDKCDFSAAPHDQYRVVFSLAIQKGRTEWQPIHAWLSRDISELQSKIAARLNARISALTSKDTPPAMRIAAMHAVLRALGAQYWKTWDGRVNPYSDGGDKHVAIVHYTYFLDVHRLYAYSPIIREAIISIAFDWSDANPQAVVSVVWPSLIERWPKRGLPPMIAPNCPLAPSDSWVLKRQADRVR